MRDAIMKTHTVKVRQRIEVPVEVRGRAQAEPFELNQGDVIQGVVRCYTDADSLTEVCDIDLGYGYILTGVPARCIRFLDAKEE
jgi:hypothetical protein